MWVLAGHHAVEPDQIKSLLGAQTPQARAAAVRVLSDERDRMPEALSWFKAAASDKNDRVKLEAARALSLYPSADAMAAVLDIAKGPMDKWLKYTVEHSLAANEASWRSDFLAGRLGKGNEAGQKVLLEILASSKAGNAAVPFLRTLLSQEDTSKETRNKAMTALTALKGNSNKGREVFVRACTACHKVGNGEGNEFGPNLHQVATRLKDRYKLVESVIDPNAEVDKKYLSTRIATSQGKIYSGLVISENPKEVVLFDGKEKRAIPVADIEERVQLKQSSMPEGLAGAMAPVEFLDLMEYLATLK
jgi:putative heme-binding domain-containing protein